ncbi:MAG: hypothetical protein QRY71_02805 [Candidatus Rhabdochlamydia sp.]
MSIFNQLFLNKRWVELRLSLLNINPITIHHDQKGVHAVFGALETQKTVWINQLIGVIATELLLIVSASFTLRKNFFTFRSFTWLNRLTCVGLTALFGIVIYRSSRAVRLASQESVKLEQQIQSFHKAVMEHGLLHFSRAVQQLSDGRLHFRASDFLSIEDKKRLCFNYMNAFLKELSSKPEDVMIQELNNSVSILKHVVNFNQNSNDPFIQGIESLYCLFNYPQVHSINEIFNKVEKAKASNQEMKPYTAANVMKLIPTVKLKEAKSEESRKILEKSMAFTIYQALNKLQGGQTVAIEDLKKEYDEYTHKQMVADKIEDALKRDDLSYNAREELKKKHDGIDLRFIRK